MAGLSNPESTTTPRPASASDRTVAARDASARATIRPCLAAAAPSGGAAQAVALSPVQPTTVQPSNRPSTRVSTHAA